MDRPITFKAPMIRALLDGRKTQTRRIIKPQPALAKNEFIDECDYCRSGWAKWTRGNGTICDGCTCQEVKGIPVHNGDSLWVRETFSECPLNTYYRATEVDPLEVKWIPSRFMPRRASRLTLVVTDVKVEKLGEISDNDAREEGAGVFLAAPRECQYRAAFRMLWDSIHGADA